MPHGVPGGSFTYERLNAAFRLLNAGAPFIALAANRVFKDDDGALSMDAGAFVEALRPTTVVAGISEVVLRGCGFLIALVVEVLFALDIM